MADTRMPAYLNIIGKKLDNLPYPSNNIVPNTRKLERYIRSHVSGAKITNRNVTRMGISYGKIVD